MVSRQRSVATGMALGRSFSGGLMRSATQRWWLGLFVAAALIAVLAELRAQIAPGEDVLVLEADQALGAALRADDKSVARRLLSLQFTYVDANGKIHERKDFLADLKTAAAAAPSDPVVKIYGRIGMVTGYRKSADGRDVYFLDIWAKQKRTWRALVNQNVALAKAEAQGVTPIKPDAAELEKLREIAKFLDCKNPCETIPYRVRSPAEQDIVNTFQMIEKATVAHDAAEYAKHMADEFVHYRSDSPPISKSERIAIIEDQKKQNIPVVLTAIQSMRLWVYGDGAAMISDNGVPDDTQPLLRIARVWVKRNGQWQMVVSVQTDVK
jgi:hypothetical protein